jgi:hypothetical protein
VRSPSGHGEARPAEEVEGERHPAVEIEEQHDADLVAAVERVVQVGVVEHDARAVPPVVRLAGGDERLVPPRVLRGVAVHAQPATAVGVVARDHAAVLGAAEDAVDGGLQGATGIGRVRIRPR